MTGCRMYHVTADIGISSSTIVGPSSELSVGVDYGCTASNGRSDGVRLGGAMGSDSIDLLFTHHALDGIRDVGWKNQGFRVARRR